MHKGQEESSRRQRADDSTRALRVISRYADDVAVALEQDRLLADNSHQVVSEPNIPTAWIGADELPLHFANAFAASAGPNAVFVLLGSVVPSAAQDGNAPPYVPVRPIVRLAIAPAAMPGLINALETAHKVQQEQAEVQDDDR